MLYPWWILFNTSWLMVREIWQLYLWSSIWPNIQWHNFLINGDEPKQRYRCISLDIAPKVCKLGSLYHLCHSWNGDSCTPWLSQQENRTRRCFQALWRILIYQRILLNIGEVKKIWKPSTSKSIKMPILFRPIAWLPGGAQSHECLTFPHDRS